MCRFTFGCCEGDENSLGCKVSHGCCRRPAGTPGCLYTYPCCAGGPQVRQDEHKGLSGRERLINKSYWVVKNAGLALSGNTSKLTLIFSWLIKNQSRIGARILFDPESHKKSLKKLFRLLVVKENTFVVARVRVLLGVMRSAENVNKSGALPLLTVSKDLITL